MTRVGSADGIGTGEVISTTPETRNLDASALYVRTPFYRPRHELYGADARTLAHVLGSVVDAVRSGAHSARSLGTDGLTYADGWAAAATLVALVAADALAIPPE